MTDIRLSDNNSFLLHISWSSLIITIPILTQSSSWIFKKYFNIFFPFSSYLYTCTILILSEQTVITHFSLHFYPHVVSHPQFKNVYHLFSCQCRRVIFGTPCGCLKHVFYWFPQESLIGTTLLTFMLLTVLHLNSSCFSFFPLNLRVSFPGYKNTWLTYSYICDSNFF